MPPPDDSSRLRHIVDASLKAVQFSQGRSRHNLDTDEMLDLALVRILEIIGEAAGGISGELCSRYPHIPWRQMSGMRHRLIHVYFEVNMDVVWKTVQEELPPLIVQKKALTEQKLSCQE